MGVTPGTGMVVSVASEPAMWTFTMRTAGSYTSRASGVNAPILPRAASSSARTATRSAWVSSGRSANGHNTPRTSPTLAAPRSSGLASESRPWSCCTRDEPRTATLASIIVDNATAPAVRARRRRAYRALMLAKGGTSRGRKVSRRSSRTRFSSDMVALVLPQQRRERAAGPCQPRFDRADWHVELTGDRLQV